MKISIDILKVIATLILMIVGHFVVTTIIVWLLIMLVPLTSIAFVIISDVLVLVYFTLAWILLFRDRKSGEAFYKSIRLKKVYIVITVIFIFFLAIAFNRAMQSVVPLFEGVSGGPVSDTVYEDHAYGFRFTYPMGSIFAHAHPETGFIVRFFLPGGENIKGDEENIGIRVSSANSTETVLKRIQDDFSKNGPIDTKEVVFGGQKGYRVIFTSDYTSPKGTQELTYLTVKDGTAFEVNYFPVVKERLPTIDGVAESFEFIK